MIQVRERALITSSEGQLSSLDIGVVTKATFDWLLDLHNSWGTRAPLFQQNGKQFLRLNAYVGILQSPSGELIEILPKTQESITSDSELVRLRQLLQRMVIKAFSLKPKESGTASLTSTNTPIHEWIFGQFLAELTTLVGKGLKNDYIRVEEESRFIKGQMDMSKQLRKGPDKSTYFDIRHDLYSPDRIENRLLKTAVDYVLKVTKTSENWRLANKLAHFLTEIPNLIKPEQSLFKWQHNRAMMPYEPVFPWCEIIIQKFNPSFQIGKSRGISFLFSMDKLFEVFVAESLKKRVIKPSILRSQIASQYFVKHHSKLSSLQEDWFQLKPDLMLLSNGKKNVMDTKWKLLNSELNTSKDKYELSQADFYQLFTYGHKYMNGEGHMLLIYPVNPRFKEPLPIFNFSNDLHLWVVPFDLYSEEIIGGAWQEHFSINNKTQFF